MDPDIDPKVDIGVAIGIGPIPAGWELILAPFSSKTSRVQVQSSLCTSCVAHFALLPPLLCCFHTDFNQQTGAAFKKRGTFCSSRQRRVKKIKRKPGIFVKINEKRWDLSCLLCSILSNHAA